MKVSRRKAGDVVVLTLDGIFDSDALPMARRETEEILAAGALKVCINCSRVTFVNSTALGFLVELAKRLKQLDGECVLSQLSDFFRSTARVLELHYIFEIFETDGEALAHLLGDVGDEE
jgi:anti-anti-sigma factor